MHTASAQPRIEAHESPPAPLHTVCGGGGRSRAGPLASMRTGHHADPMLTPATGSTLESVASFRAPLPRHRRMVSAGRYLVDLQQPLGSGAFGTVYRGRDAVTKRTVAVKRALGKEPKQVAALRNECSALQAVSDPHVVSTLAAHVDDATGDHYLVLEWLPSDSVHSTVSAHRFRLHESTIREYARDALCGLAAVHEAGLVHLDVKPENMLLTVEGRVKIADFGGCMAAGSITAQHGERTFTPAYAAPELFSESPPEASVYQDVWALACSIVCMATGRAPWFDAGVEMGFPFMYFMATLPAGAHPTIPRTLSMTLAALLQRCFSHDPLDRPTAYELLQHEYFHDDAAFASSGCEAEDDYAAACVAHATADACSTFASGAASDDEALAWERLA